MYSATLLFITAAIMTAGGLIILVVGKHRTKAEQLQTVLHGIVPLIAACSYFAMATLQGAVTLPVVGSTMAALGDHRTFYWARYLDWTFTTPLLLISVSLTAMRGGQKSPGSIVGVVLADLLMIVTAFAFGLSVDPALKWSWFGISCLAFLGVYYVLWSPNLEANKLERDDTRKNYRTNASILSVLWFLYPFVLAASPDGLGLVGDATAILGIAILDVLSKVAYGLLAVASDTKATNRDLSEGPIAMDTRQGRSVPVTA